MSNRENSEWIRFAWFNANDFHAKRILFIGDSITEGFRNSVSKLIGERYCVDYMVSSRGITDVVYEKELRYALADYKYEIVHYNNGLHGSHISNKDYEAAVIKAVGIIREHCQNMMIATSTPVTKNSSPHLYNEGANKIVLERNSIIRGIADKLKIPINDLYAEMDGHPEYKNEDGIHYNVEGQMAQAQHVLKLLCKFIENFERECRGHGKK